MSDVTLRLISTTDLHMQLGGFNYYTDAPETGGSLAALAPVIARLREEVSPSLLCDTGDFLQGSPLADQAAADGARPHPMVAAMNRLGYDAITLGNHEFDYGLDVLLRTLEDSEASIVCANLAHADGTPGPAPFTLRRLRNPGGDTLTVAIVGFITPVLQTDEVVAEDILMAARTILPAIRRARPDLTVALCHSGIAEAKPEHGMENAALPLAALDGIDVVLAGHTHDRFPGPDIAPRNGLVDPVTGIVRGKPVLLAGAYAGCVGCLDLRLRAGDDGRWRIAGHAARLHPPAADPDPAILALAAPAHHATRAALNTRIGTATGPIHSWFEAIGQDLTQPLAAAAQRRWARQVLGDDAPPLLIATPSFRFGGRSAGNDFLHIPEGPILRRHIASLSPYDNALQMVTRWGWQLREWLERGAARYRLLRPGIGDQPLLNSRFPGYHFDSFDGLTYRIDASRPVGEGRIVDLRHEGLPVEDDDRFIVLTNRYRAFGGGAMPAIQQADWLRHPRASAKAVLDAHLDAEGSVAPQPPGIWSLVPVPGASALFEVPETACALLPEGIAALGPSAPGRLTVRLTF